MTEKTGSIRTYLQRLRENPLAANEAFDMLRSCLDCSNGNQGANTYLWQDAEWSEWELEGAFAGQSNRSASHASVSQATASVLPLLGLPVSVKDCFDLEGVPTSCGSRFYIEKNGAAERDSWLVARLRAMGAVITGKTHLHALAYGITGENRDFGDCVQPRDATALTGGSSSGAAASVQEGSALAAIGTDTGGSVRVPAALCGLAGYRASLGRGSWQGGAHLAQSFDTIGWLFRDLEDAPILGSLFAPHPARQDVPEITRFGFVHESFLQDCEPSVLDSQRECIAELKRLGLHGTSVEVPWWEEAQEIFAAIQAWEAARIHAGNFAEFEMPIQQRLEWGAGIGDDEIHSLRERHEQFRERMASLLAEHQLIVLPAAPVARLNVGEDHSRTRGRLLRYTTPASLGGMPAITVPFAAGGIQIIAAREDDQRLLHVAEAIGRARNSVASS
uniref:Putative Enantiomer-selective amidase n=1 Tax=mine drainage metagenome TaxID=410659 RepID=E6QJ03_9ZZZZ